MTDSAFGRLKQPNTALKTALTKKLGVYYSHHLDWHEKDGGDPDPSRGLNCNSMHWGNDWDFPNRAEKNFANYFHGKVIPQVTELLTNYGDIFMLWLDGACGARADGQPVQDYDFERIWNTAVKLQPDIVMSGCAPDVRWIGNESGKTRESEWNVVPKFKYDQQNFAANCQTDDDMRKFQKRCQDVMLPDMGSREFLSGFDEFMWYPAEVDVSIRLGWFYHPLQRFTLKSLNHLMKIYYTSAGNNSLFLLNIPPNKNGLFANSDVKRLKEMGKWLKKEDELVIKDFTRKDDQGGFEIRLHFPKQSVDRIRLSEDTTKSQRVEKFSIYANGGKIFGGTIIGFSKIAIFEPTVTDNLTIKIEECRKEPYINKTEVVATGAYRLK